MRFGHRGLDNLAIKPQRFGHLDPSDFGQEDRVATDLDYAFAVVRLIALAVCAFVACALFGFSAILCVLTIGLSNLQHQLLSLNTIRFYTIRL